MTDNTKQMGTEPIKKLVLQYSIPTVIAMVVNSIYNVVDRIFIGRFVGEEALAGVTVIFPLMLMMMALASLLGGGAAPLISIKLGEKKAHQAAGIFGNMITLIVLSATLIVLLGFLFAEDLILLLKGEAVIEYALPYFRIILLGMIFQLFSMNLSNIVRTEGQPRLAMASQIISAVTNLVLDFLFVVVFRWGIQGAAWATITGQIVGAVILITYYLRGKSSLAIDASSFILKFSVVRSMVALGVSQFIGQFGASFALIFLNLYLVELGGTAALAAIGAINSLYTLFIMPLFGIQFGTMPLIGYNYGAGLRHREREALFFAAAIAVVFATIVWAFLEIFPGAALSLFLDPGSETHGIAVKGLRLFVLMLPALGFQFIGNSYFQAINKPVTALFLSSLRQFVLLVPLLVLVLAPLWGLTGVWLATPIADGISTIVTALLLNRALRHEDAPELDLSDNSTVLVS